MARIGAVQAVRPGAAGIATLAMSSNPDASPQERLNYLVRFVADHIDPADLERIYFDMMVGSLASDAVERIARALATWGTARPYVAVVTLTAITGHHWRMIRQKLLAGGVLDPLSLPSMHVLLDVTEELMVESVSSSRDPERELASLYRRLYGPSVEADALNEDGTPAVPVGFKPEEVEESFDAFARAAR